MMDRSLIPALLLLLLVGVHAARTKQKVTPVEKVVQLLEKLKDQISKDGRDDAASYDKFACFCKHQADSKLHAITKSEELIDIQTATIKQLEGEIDEKSSSIADNKEKKEKLEQEQKEAAEKRAKEHEAYVEEETDLASAIAAIDGAIEALEQSKAAIQDSKLLMIRKSIHRSVLETITQRARIPPEQLKAVLALLDMGKEPGKPAAYKYGSQEIIDILRGLQKEIKKDKYDLDEEEATKRHDYEMEAQERGNTIKFLQEDIEEAATSVAKKTEELQKTKKDKEEEEKNMKADKAFMEELTSTCESKAKDFDQRSTARAGEITAISEALEIMKSGIKQSYKANKKLTDLTATAGKVQAHANVSATKKAVGLVAANRTASFKGHWAWVKDPLVPTYRVWVKEQQPMTEEEAKEIAGSSKLEEASKLLGTSFLQVRRTESGPAKAIDFLTQKAALLKSHTLSNMAMKIQLAMGKDHFVKVRGIINDLIAKLKADAEAEADQKSFCDEEMGKAIDSRDEASGKIEGSTADIDKAESKIVELGEEIEELGKHIADLRKALFEATELRTAEKADNEKTIRDSEAGVEAIENALKVLKDFYDKGFLQMEFTPKGGDRDGNTVGDLAPKTQEGEYHGNKDAASGIIGLMEVIQSDFERTIETTKKSEDDAQSEFEEYKKNTEEEIEEKGKLKKDKEKEKKTTESDLIGFKNDLNAAQNALKDAKDELTKLKPMCVDTGMDWKTRRAKLKQEIESLKQALAILEDY